MIPKLKTFAIISLLIYPVIGSSAIIERDWLAEGDKLITYDSQTGLEWLDLTVSVGWTYSEAENFQDFTHANINDLSTFVSNALGAEVTLPLNDIYYTGQTNYFVSLFGVTIPETLVAFDSTQGLLSDEEIPGWYYVAQIVDGKSASPSRFDIRNSATNGWRNNSSGAGHYLIRQSPVPIPPSILLFISGIVCIFSIKNKR